MQKVRIDNMKRAREVWRLKLEGIESDIIAKQLSTSVSIIEDIIEYTKSDHYTPLRKEPSYYDERLLAIRQISTKKTQLQSVVNALQLKKKIFSILFKITIAFIAFLIMT